MTTEGMPTTTPTTTRTEAAKGKPGVAAERDAMDAAVPVARQTNSVEALQARRQALALDAAEGKPGAAVELEAVEGELAALQRATERAALAEQARAARSQAEAAAREAARRREAEAQLARLGARRIELARTVDLEADRFVTALRDLLAVADEMYQLTGSLGKWRPRLRLVDAVAGYLAWRLGGMVPGLGHGEKFYRKPLAEQLGGADQPDAPPPGPTA
jgi:hypothetical protein